MRVLSPGCSVRNERFCRTASAVPWNHPSELGVCCAARTSTKPRENGENLYVAVMCWCSETELNWVSTKMRIRPEFRAFESGTSISR